MGIIQTGKHQRRLAREFNLREPAPARELNNQIQPVVIVADLSSFQAASSEIQTTYGMALSLAQAANNRCHARLVNPVGSGIYTVVDRVLIGQNSGTPISYFIGTQRSSAAGGGPVPNPVDLQVQGTGGSVGAIASDGLAISQTQTLFAYVSSGTGEPMWFDVEDIVLTPNTTLWIEGQNITVAAHSVYVSFILREGAAIGFQP